MANSAAITRRRRRRRIAGALTSIVLLAWTATAGSVLVVREPIRDPQVIISLASHEWERLPEASRHARAFPDARVVLTVPEHITAFTCHDCPNRVARLRALGVDESRVQVLRLIGPGTHAEALSALAFARAGGVKRLLVVTSPYHSRRSLAVFRTVFEGSGIEIGIEPATASSRAKPRWWWWQADDRAYVPYEWAAMAYYVWAYGIHVF